MNIVTKNDVCFEFCLEKKYKETFSRFHNLRRKTDER